MGRKPLYSDPEALEARMEAYFADCEGVEAVDADGAPILYHGAPAWRRAPKPQGWAGMCVFLGFSSKSAMIELAKKPGFDEVVARARLRLEAYAERRLFDRDGQRGAEFSLRCNYGWAVPEVGAASAGESAGVIIIPARGASTL